MNVYLVIILAILIGDYLLNLIIENLNIRHLKTDLPGDSRDITMPISINKRKII